MSLRLRPCPLLATGLLAALAACATPRPAPAPVAVSQGHFRGSVLTGPLGGVEVEEGEAQGLILRLSRREELVPEGDPLAASVDLVVLDGGDLPLRSRAQLSRGVRRAATAPATTAERWADEWTGVALAGATTVWWVEPLPDVEDAPRVSWERFAVELSRSAGGSARIELALTFTGDVVPPTEPPFPGEEPLPAPAPERRTERLVLAEAFTEGEAEYFFLPAPSPKAPGGGYVLEVRLAPGPDEDPAVAAALEAARARLMVATDVAEEPRGDEDGFGFGSKRALETLAVAGRGRTALLYLTRGTGASLTEQVGLLVDDPVLADGLDVLQERLANEGVAVDDVEALGWFLEESTLLWITARMLDPECEVPVELSSLLMRHAGELARYPDMVREVVTASASLDGLRERIEAENRIFLEDGDPAARVRAFDWLRGHGVELGDYDPLAPRIERREALARLEEAWEESEADR